MTRRVIIVHEEIEDLENRADYTVTDNEVIEQLRATLPMWQLAKLARRLAQAKADGGYITVGVEFARGTARRIVTSESETLLKE